LLILFISHIVPFIASPNTAAVSHRKPASSEISRDSRHVRGLDKKDNFSYKGHAVLVNCDITTHARYDVGLHFDVCRHFILLRGFSMLSCYTVQNNGIP